LSDGNGQNGYFGSRRYSAR
jgi:hypothetical protein